MAEELFDLKANLIVSEAEIKFESKKEVDALRSELSFKVLNFLHCLFFGRILMFPICVESRISFPISKISVDV